MLDIEGEENLLIIDKASSVCDNNSVTLFFSFSQPHTNILYIL